MAKVKYTGSADQKILFAQDMKTLGFEDHPGLYFTPGTGHTLEIEDEALVETLVGLRDFALVPDAAEELEADHTKDELLEQAKGLGLTGLSKLSKEELADRIADRLENPPVNEPTITTPIISEPHS